ncbi:MAG: hypothetical protein M3506_10130 [Chloroflexota bacterium]|nr:hypothetical protein [Chloroflexota bacterium]
MDCTDRIAQVLAESALAPVRLLRGEAPLAAVTVRVPSRGRRFNITVHKRWHDGSAQPPAYWWSVCETEPDGTERHGGIVLSGAGEEHPDPEDAFWAAIEATAEAMDEVSVAG